MSALAKKWQEEAHAAAEYDGEDIDLHAPLFLPGGLPMSFGRGGGALGSKKKFVAQYTGNIAALGQKKKKNTAQPSASDKAAGDDKQSTSGVEDKKEADDAQNSQQNKDNNQDNKDGGDNKTAESSVDNSDKTGDKAEEKKKEEKEDEDSDEEENWKFCKVCNLKFNTPGPYWMHKRGIAHMNNELASQKATNVEHEECGDNVDWTYCKLCKLSFNNDTAYWVHTRGIVHCQKAEENKRMTGEQDDITSKLPPLQPMSKTHGWCALCKMELESRIGYMMHVYGLAHRKNEAINGIQYTPQLTDELKSLELAPGDIGYSGEDFFCKVCNVPCTGVQSFEAHLVGQKHGKKLKTLVSKEVGIANINQVKEGPDRLKKKKGVPIIQDEIDKCAKPLIGLDYLTEYQMSDIGKEPLYICDLCEAKMDPRQVVNHVIGFNHRMKYFKFHDPNSHTTLWPVRKKSDKNRMATRFAYDLEQRDGRHMIRVRLEINPNIDVNMGNTSADGKWEVVEVPGARSARELPGMFRGDEKAKHYKEEKFKAAEDGDYNEDDDDEEDPEKYDLAKDDKKRSRRSRSPGKKKKKKRSRSSSSSSSSSDSSSSSSSSSRSRSRSKSRRSRSPSRRGGYDDEYDNGRGYPERGGFRGRGGFPPDRGFRGRGGFPDRGFPDRGGFRGRGGRGFPDRGGRGGFPDRGGFRGRGGWRGGRGRGGYDDFYDDRHDEPMEDFSRGRGDFDRNPSYRNYDEPRDRRDRDFDRRGDRNYDDSRRDRDYDRRDRDYDRRDRGYDPYDDRRDRDRRDLSLERDGRGGKSYDSMESRADPRDSRLAILEKQLMLEKLKMSMDKEKYVQFLRAQLAGDDFKGTSSAKPSESAAKRKERDPKEIEAKIRRLEAKMTAGPEGMEPGPGSNRGSTSNRTEQDLEDMLNKFQKDTVTKPAYASQSDEPFSYKKKEEPVKLDIPKTASDQAKSLLASLGECTVGNETDAEIALQVSSALTKALAEYKNKGKGGIRDDEIKQQIEQIASASKALEEERREKSDPSSYSRYSASSLTTLKMPQKTGVTAEKGDVQIRFVKSDKPAANPTPPAQPPAQPAAHPPVLSQAAKDYLAQIAQNPGNTAYQQPAFQTQSSSSTSQPAAATSAAYSQASQAAYAQAATQGVEQYTTAAYTQQQAAYGQYDPNYQYMYADPYQQYAYAAAYGYQQQQPAPGQPPLPPGPPPH